MKLIKQFDVIKKDFISGKTILYPTEGVYGIGCNPFSDTAIQKVLSIKKRDPKKGLILIASHFEQIQAFIQPDLQILQKINSIYPSFTTCVVPKSKTCSSLISGNHFTIAFRLTEHPIVKKLCNTFDLPLISTSANISGNPPVKNHKEAFDIFNNKIDFLIDGHLGSSGKPSRIIKINDNDIKVIRE